jgi:hypothetical protein
VRIVDPLSRTSAKAGDYLYDELPAKDGFVIFQNFYLKTAALGESSKIKLRRCVIQGEVAALSDIDPLRS